MTDSSSGPDLTRRQAELREEASTLLASGLRGLLTEYGDLQVGGSYALHLMTWRDLDLMVAPSALKRSEFFRLGGKLRGSRERTARLNRQIGESDRRASWLESTPTPGC